MRTRKTCLAQTKAHRGSSDAFTLVEMLVVIAVIGILAALLLPILSKGKQRGQQVYCLNNGRQMTAALTMYAGDFKDFFPPNPDDGNTIPGHNWCSGQAGVGQPDEFNPDILKDQSRTLLSSYLKGNVTVFHCPGDTRTGLYQGIDPSLLGKRVAAARTFSMNQAVGTICPGFDASESSGFGPYEHSGEPNLSVNGPWLNSEHTNKRDSPWITEGKWSSIRAPGPAMLWLLVDEDVSNLNDAAFAFGMEIAKWHDAPGTYHDGGCGFAFADGHSESHHWKSTASKQGHQTRVANANDLQDWLWMRDRTSANTNGVMPAPR
jgi:prepilin-type N-terminal cleavage/methylation domain-containing protein/prepilin-type processing-associated H-X9-DG protein